MQRRRVWALGPGLKSYRKCSPATKRTKTMKRTIEELSVVEQRYHAVMEVPPAVVGR